MPRRPAPAAPERLPEAARARADLHRLIDDGLARFDRGDYWHAHESWEEAWKLDRGPDRHYLKGLIQFAAALHHLRHGNRRPVQRLLDGARAHLAAHQGPRWPFDSSAILRLIDRASERARIDDIPEWPKLTPHHRRDQI